MPKVREGYKQLATQVPAALAERMEALAKDNGRSLADEIAHAFERHTAAPPRVRVVTETPPMPDAPAGRRESEVSPPAPKKATPRRGKGGAS